MPPPSNNIFEARIILSVTLIMSQFAWYNFRGKVSTIVRLIKACPTRGTLIESSLLIRRPNEGQQALISGPPFFVIKTERLGGRALRIKLFVLDV